MLNEKIYLPIELYEQHLKIIKGIKFTSREIDILACMINGRTAKTIPSFLSISPKTVTTHMANIRGKTGCTSRESVIDFLEASDKLFFIKHEYYASLVKKISFEKYLKDISRTQYPGTLACYIICDQTLKENNFICSIESHLKFLKMKTEKKIIEEDKIEHYLTKREDTKDLTHSLIVISEIKFIEFIVSIEKTNKFLENFTFIVLKNSSPNTIKSTKHIDFSENANYYFSFFELLKRLLPQTDLNNIVEDFKQNNVLAISEPPKNERSQEIKNSDNKGFSFFLKAKFFENKKWNFFLGFTLSMSLLLVGYFILMSLPNEEFRSLSKQKKPFIRSELVLPSDTVLLNRSELIEQIDRKFKKQAGGAQAIALVGIGGAGKTTLARQYARTQKTNLMWEINAETQEALKDSFVRLAQHLAKTEEDQKELRGILDIKKPIEREERTLNFVKVGLKPIPEWLLIYDNVEYFSDIHKYFPHTTEEWGIGKVILTTRNIHIGNNGAVNYILPIDELTPKEKLELFSKIMNHGLSYSPIVFSVQDIKFLERIPPFPLDVSIAAYYLKSTGISYNQYLENIKNYNKEFDTVQTSLLKETGAYLKTRYGIITQSLEHIMNQHKDFGDLLLFISLLDSQNIPKDLLEKYKTSAVVDSFIYTLKRHSLITNGSSHNLATLSIHRSIQAITLAYLTKALKLDKNQHVIEHIWRTVKDYAVIEVDKEELHKITFLIKHLDMFLSHQKLLTDFAIASISDELGNIYKILGNYGKARELLEKSIVLYKKNSYENHPLFARTLGNLGSVYRDLGNYDKAKKFLQKAIAVYRKNSYENHPQFALTLQFLGIVHRDLGNYEKAKQSLEESLAVYKKNSYKNQPILSRTLTWLGNVYREQGHYEKAKQLLEESILIFKKNSYTSHPWFAWTLSCLGNIYREQGDYEKAKQLYEESIVIFNKNSYKIHPWFAWTLGCLGNVYREQGHYEKAKQLIEESIVIFKKNFDNHPWLARALEELGNIYREQGKYTKAEQLIKEGLEVYKKNFFNNSHPLFARALGSLGSVYRDLGNYEKAKDLLEHNFQVYEKVYGKDHNNTATVAMNLGGLYMLEGKMDSSENLIITSLGVFQKNKHPRAYKCLECLSELYLKKSMKPIHILSMEEAQRFEMQAVNYLKQALEIVKAHFSVDSPHKVRIELRLKSLEKT